MDYMERLTEENEGLREQLDSVVDDIVGAIEGIGETVAQSKCRDCIETAKLLFRMLMEYGDENAQTDALERFSYLTGISLND